MLGDQQQIKELRHLYNSMLEEKYEYERKITKLNVAFGIKHNQEIGWLNIKIIELQAEMIEIDKTINHLARIK